MYHAKFIDTIIVIVHIVNSHSVYGSQIHLYLRQYHLRLTSSNYDLTPKHIDWYFATLKHTRTRIPFGPKAAWQPQTCLHQLFGNFFLLYAAAKILIQTTSFPILTN